MCEYKFQRAGQVEYKLGVGDYVCITVLLSPVLLPVFSPVLLLVGQIFQ